MTSKLLADTREPIIHSESITGDDQLPEGHPLAFEIVYCDLCGRQLHASHNECMTDYWVEWRGLNLCGNHFAPMLMIDDEGLELAYWDALVKQVAERRAEREANKR